MRAVIGVAVAIGLTAVVAWGVSHDRVAAPWLPNQPDAKKAGKIEITRYPDKLVVSNFTADAAERCGVLIDGSIRGDVGTLSPGQTVTVMRTRFSPYTEADDFYAKAKKSTRMQCLVKGQLVEVTFEQTYEGTITTPQE